MKITLIHGQSHKGTSYHAGRMLVDQLTDKENVKEFFLPRDMPHFCNGCYACLKDEKKCPHYPALSPITESIYEADLLVFTTPVYCMRTTGAMKALLDHLFIWWASHRPQEEMFSKKAVIISVGAGTGMTKTADDIKVSLNFWGISDIIVCKQRSLSSTWVDADDKIKEEVRQKITRIAEKIKQNKHAKVSLKVKFIFTMMRMMQKKGMSGSKEDRMYWEKKGWLANQRPWKRRI